MIVVKISGGLGNQLFQYSFGRYLSVKFNTELKFDIQINSNSSNFTNRSIGLINFNINLNLANNNEIVKFKYFENEILARTERKLVKKFPFLNKRYVVQDLIKYNNSKPTFRDNCYYDGYWQSEEYFKSIEDIIRNDLDFKFQLSQNIESLLDDINSNESVSIHIRRGDYISIKANSKLLHTDLSTLEYYKKGIDFFITKFGHPRFFVFSDDIEWAKDNFEGSQFKFVDFNIDCPAIDMFLMSRCKNNIIANSSFSWWGAWLNPNPFKIVIAPKQWYNGKLNNSTIELIPETWIRI